VCVCLYTCTCIYMYMCAYVSMKISSCINRRIVNYSKRYNLVELKMNPRSRSDVCCDAEMCKMIFYKIR
jgi:hypothetical protein